jgi:gentisate 1,2-dioxygenase
MNDASLLKPATLEDLNEALAEKTFRAGWNKHEPSLWREPRTQFVPFRWRWSDAKPGLDRAGDLISAELAERRNLFLVNPHEGNHYATLRTLVSAYQMILPGERARSHRHAPNALRLVLDVPSETYTVVDGVRIDMRPGDVLLTPGNSWHGHANDGDAPGYWIDFLDVPLVQLLEPMFLENWPQGFQDPVSTARPAALVFDRPTYEAQVRQATPDAEGRRRHVLDAPSLASMELSVELLRKDAPWRPVLTTENQVVAVVAGSGTTTISDQVITWEEGDVLSIPSWHAHRHETDGEAILFCVSDRPTLEKLGFQKRLQPDHEGVA